MAVTVATNNIIIYLRSCIVYGLHTYIRMYIINTNLGSKLTAGHYKKLVRVALLLIIRYYNRYKIFGYITSIVS